MLPGKITNFKTLNDKHFLEVHGEKFTKGELIVFHQLTRYSVKVIGVCNARKFGVISIHHTIRNQGGYAHNIFVFHRFDRPLPHKLMGQQSPLPPCSSGKNPDISVPET
ncbi:hypothetical protein SAMN04488137_3463 [Fictibacillus solisalsi]|uniref:Uncharacterized protein n=1 Tax=Fictibacillus solisalsi TaxID=459525 RepID=A0A1G9YKI2_9BACL|nr:hypothetical protein SAMN04488137_3463 [Fictibacillus solisalsi]